MGSLVVFPFDRRLYKNSCKTLPLTPLLVDRILRLGVRHQSFWVQSSFNLREYLAHLVGFIMQRTCGVASAESRVFCV